MSVFFTTWQNSSKLIFPSLSWVETALGVSGAIAGANWRKIGKYTNFIVENNGLVHDLLELRVLQVVADHHLQHLEQLAVGHVPVVVHVIDPEAVQSSEDNHNQFWPTFNFSRLVPHVEIQHPHHLGSENKQKFFNHADRTECVNWPRGTNPPAIAVKDQSCRTLFVSPWF